MGLLLIRLMEKMLRRFRGGNSAASHWKSDQIFMKVCLQIVPENPSFNHLTFYVDLSFFMLNPLGNLLALFWARF